MFDAKDLKPRITVTETTVECLVRGCPEMVTRQRRSFKRAPEFLCPKHKIYISASTFEYEDRIDNLLWRNDEDMRLLQAIHRVKRESRMARERSEDALTWNVFRFLEKRGLLAPSLAPLTGSPVTDPQIMYWSYSTADQGTWPWLARARAEFGEQPRRSSEPDLIVTSDEALFFIEPKLTADNKTTPSKPHDTKRYLTGGGGWYEQVFRSDYVTVAVQDQRYELMRFWLLGSWIAAELAVDFFLINLVREGQEEEIEYLFLPHVKADDRRRFVRWTWEDIYHFVREKVPAPSGRDQFLSYFDNKTIGYDSRRELQLAFRPKGARPKE
jgi:hypothetical protein